MGTAHIDCASDLPAGGEDLCAELESGNYSSLLERYEAIEAETSGGNTAVKFNETRRDQLALAALRAEFEATRRDYELARRAGNEDEAREQARKLQRLADQIEALGGEVNRDFAVLEDEASLDFTAAASDINETIEEVQTVRRTAENETFTGTRLTATANGTATFEEPVTVSGRLRSENQTNLSEARIVIDDGAQTFETRTNETGFYRLPYRPVRTERGETTLTVSYRPATQAPYLGSNASANVTIGGTTATFRSVFVPQRVSFVTNSSVSGVVQAAGEPVSDAPVTVTIAGQRLATGRTSADGSFIFSVDVPPTIANGPTALHVRAGASNTALRPTRETTAVIVDETAMQLGGEATVVDEQLRVTGQLRPATESDREIGSRPLELTYSTETRTVRTAVDGNFTFATTVNATPETVTISYTENGTNLAGAKRELAVTDDTPAQETSLWETISTSLRGSPLQAGGIAMLVVFVFGWLLARRWRGTADQGAQPSDSELPDETFPEDDPSSTAFVDDPNGTTEQLLETAREQLEADPDSAVQMSYAAVRAAVPTEEPRTHREFYRDYRTNLDDTAVDSLERLTSAFEHAAFAPTAVSHEQATAAVDAARRILEPMSGGP
jgi:cell fate (sporulation/competence/biofilm development) regulator YlbF (YheA/YmcA/DUF963 family)